MKPQQQLRGLYAITPDWDDLSARFANPLAAVEAVLAGGCACLQYRDKNADQLQKWQRSQALRALCKTYQTLFIINDELELAEACAADGVHLGGTDGDLAAARARLGADKIIGASCYNELPRAAAASAAGADYLAFGAVFPSGTKPNAPRADFAVLQHAHQQFSAPICAIGGITLDTAPQLAALGVDLCAVITDLFAPNSLTAIQARAAAYHCLFRAENCTKIA